MFETESPAWRVVGPYRLHRGESEGNGYQTWLGTAKGAGGLFHIEVAASMEPQAFQPGKIPNHPGALSSWDLGAADERKSKAGWHRAFYLAKRQPMGSTLVDLACAARDRVERLPLAEVLNMTSQVARVLHACHVQSKGAHGRLRPSEIFVERSGLVLVGGFEGALRAPAWSPDELAYAAPEVVMGEPVVPASDIFSLGIVLYELATGRRVVNTSSIGRAVLSLISSRPKPSELVPELPAAFDRIVGRAMAQGVDERYETAETFACALDALEHELTETRDNQHVAALNERLGGYHMEKRAEFVEEMKAAQ